MEVLFFSCFVFRFDNGASEIYFCAVRKTIALNFVKKTTGVNSDTTANSQLGRGIKPSAGQLVGANAFTTFKVNAVSRIGACACADCKSCMVLEGDVGSDLAFSRVAPECVYDDDCWHENLLL